MPNSVLLELNRPVISDREYLGALRVANEREKLMVAFCSAGSDFLYLSEAISAGVNEYIMRPSERDYPVQIRPEQWVQGLGPMPKFFY